jgi:hypothetical protein
VGLTGVDSIYNLIKGEWYLFKTCGGITGECSFVYSETLNQFEKINDSDSIIRKIFVKNQLVHSVKYKIIYDQQFKWMLSNNNFKHIIKFENGFFSYEDGDMYEYYTRTKPTSISLKNNFNRSLLNFYPNPSENFVTISGVNDIVRIEIFEMNSSIIQYVQQDNEGKIDISNLNAGIYIIKVISKDKIFTRKIVKI